jgi:hypothetical protein
MDNEPDDHHRQFAVQENRAAKGMIVAVALAGVALWLVFDRPDDARPPTPAVGTLDDAGRIALIARVRAPFGPDLPPVPVPRPASVVRVEAVSADQSLENASIISAAILCASVRGIPGVTDCLMVDRTVRISLRTDAAQAWQMCRTLPGDIRAFGLNFAPDWRLEFRSPSGELLAGCPV